VPDSDSNRNEPIVVIRDLYKEFYRDQITIPVLMGINLDLYVKDFMALMGPSGSGKSTLLNLIAGLDRPTSGSIHVIGQDLGNTSEGSLARWRSEHIGFIFQLYNLIPVLTAYENVELPLTLTRLSKRERREHVEAALEVVGLVDRGDHFPRQLSGGQEQRVAIARAIATDPVLLVADEPTGDLDATSAGEILDLMQRLNEEFDKTIVMVTHDPHAAARARRLLHLEKGVLVDGQAAARPMKEAVR
jgi:putative ABC transport system ATP-binding protein